MHIALPHMEISIRIGPVNNKVRQQEAVCMTCNGVT